jgi:SAM-dependent methyltransferase
MHNTDLFLNMIKSYDKNQVEKFIAPNDSMKHENYFEVGNSAVEITKAAVLSSHINRVGHVLDLPCGHGRVLRHLVKLFPEAKFDACDLDKDGVDFCARMFKAQPIYSHEDLTQVKFPTTYDLIWVGSLFTHTSKIVTERWLNHLSNYLSPEGIVVATFHGRWSESVHGFLPYISADKWQEILKDYSRIGYGYRDYAREESHSFIEGSYGISLSKPHSIIEILEGIPDTRIYLYTERGWSDHHDVVVFGKPSHNKLIKDPRYFGTQS